MTMPVIELPTEKDVRDALGDRVKRVAPTGSRVICPDNCRPDSDFDFIVQIVGFDADTMRFLEEHFDVGESKPVDGGKSGHDVLTWVSLKRGLLNMIVTADPKFFDRYVLATRVATGLKLETKVKRVALFQAILYGNG